MGHDKIWTPAEIRRRYAAGERNFRGLEISDGGDPAAPSFRGAILDGSDFDESFISADFTGASLRGCKLRANVKCCTFDRADLRDADFRDAAIDSATFKSARLDGANFAGAGAHGYEFEPGEWPADDGSPRR